jgi:hypothetical protein
MLEALGLLGLGQGVLTLALGLGLLLDGAESSRRGLLLDLLFHARLHLTAVLTAVSLLLCRSPGALLASLARLLTPGSGPRIGLAPPPLGLAMAILEPLIGGLGGAGSLIAEMRRTFPLFGGGPPTAGVLAQLAIGEQHPGQRASARVGPVEGPLGSAAIAGQQ